MSSRNDITAVPGIKVGQVTDAGALTGCTVILTGDGAACGVDVRGGAPGTRETDLLRPGHLVDRVHAVLLSGGSAYGLDAAGGVMRYLEELGTGFDVGVTRVPIVPAAVLFDLNVGDHRIRPDAAMGYRACQNAGGPVQQGSHGAGTGAMVGKILGMSQTMRGGTGSAVARLSCGSVVGALACVNAFGDVRDPASGLIAAGARDPDTGQFLDTASALASGHDPGFSGGGLTSTTIAVVATDAKLDAAGATRLAIMAHDGMARAISPCHTMYDGDTVFVLSTGERRVSLNSLGAAACEVLARAIYNGVHRAGSPEG